MQTHPTTRSALHPFLLAVCVFAIAYVSLEPFAGWSTPNQHPVREIFHWYGVRGFLGFDALANLLAYVPLGFVTIGVVRSVWLVVGLALAFSLSLEIIQTYLPTRDASFQDALLNGVGAGLGAHLYRLYRAHPFLSNAVGRLRSLILPGVRGDYGVALLVVFLLAHLSPGLSLFSSTYFVPERSAQLEPGLQLLQVLHTAMMMTGFGLFVDLLARTRLAGGLLSLGCVFFAMASKAILAAALLQPDSWGQWLSPAVVMGVLIGAVGLLVIFWMSAAEKRIVCNVVLIVAVILPVLAPEWLFARVPVRAFDWNHGHLINFNSLSQTLLRLWPLFVSVYLLSSAGNPYQDSRQSNP